MDDDKKTFEKNFNFRCWTETTTNSSAQQSRNKNRQLKYNVKAISDEMSIQKCILIHCNWT